MLGWAWSTIRKKIHGGGQGHSMRTFEQLAINSIENTSETCNHAFADFRKSTMLAISEDDPTIPKQDPSSRALHFWPKNKTHDVAKVLTPVLEFRV